MSVAIDALRVLRPWAITERNGSSGALASLLATRWLLWAESRLTAVRHNNRAEMPNRTLDCTRKGRGCHMTVRSFRAHQRHSTKEQRVWVLRRCSETDGPLLIVGKSTACQSTCLSRTFVLAAATASIGIRNTTKRPLAADASPYHVTAHERADK